MKAILWILTIFSSLSLFAEGVHTTYLWHLQQPIYWPAASQHSPGYQSVYESMQRKAEQGGHPLNDLDEIFGKDDRKAVYQYRVKDAIGTISDLPEAGAHVNYSGCLIENVNSLGSNGWNGYSSTWVSNFTEAMNWKTTRNKPRLDVINFSFHHCLSPLVDEAVLDKEIGIYKEIYQETFGSNMSKGFFPAEFSFSQRIIPTLVKHNLEWVLVPNTHISRACKDFDLVLGSGGENCTPPNKADQLNEGTHTYFRKQIDRGCAPANAYPLAYTPHKAQYVDPDTGAISKMTVVPSAMAMSWSDGYQLYGTGDIDTIASANDPNRPMMVVLAHDGDNAFAGGYSYYMEGVTSFCHAANNAGYVPSTVDQYLEKYPVPDTDIVHVEDGSWPNADGDFGSPRFLNWNWPLVNTSGKIDIENGWAEDERNFAVITAALNRVQTAEAQSSAVSLTQIYKPDNSASNAELAWHYFLPSVTSGYMYYGVSLDMEVKPTLACNQAVGFADQVIVEANDQTAPSIWIPQRYPYNPGDIDFGPCEGYQQVTQPSDFYVWSFIYDVSGMQNVVLKVRDDLDGTNPMDSIQNETYAGGSEVNDWVSLPMTMREFPKGNVMNSPEIDFFILPDYIANQYWVKVTGYKGKLLDYYIEATDSKGNVKKSPIQHVWVGTNSGNPEPDGYVTWDPVSPQVGDTFNIEYTIADSPLTGNDTIILHYGYNGWSQDATDNTMAISEGVASYSWVIPEGVTELDFVFNNGDGAWDNNSGQDWKIQVAGSSTPYVSWTPSAPKQGDALTVSYSLADSPLSTATQLSVRIGINDWASQSDHAMTINSGVASYSFTINDTTTKLSFAFFDQADQWDRNDGDDWNVNVSEASEPDFVLDGTLDVGVEVITNGDYHLWYDIRGSILYVATESAAAHDVFLFAAQSATEPLVAAPWAKSGQVPTLDGGFLAAEMDNDYNSWTDIASGAQAAQNKASGVLEGTIDLSQAFAQIPPQVYIAVGRYENQNEGLLSVQVPASNDQNGNIENNEFLRISTTDTSIHEWSVFE